MAKRPTNAASKQPAPIALGAYWAKWCPRRVHNRFDRTVPTCDDFEPSEAAAQRMAEGVTFEAEVRARMTELLGPDLVDFSDSDLNQAEWIEATAAAMKAGKLVVAGGQLPADAAGGRVGKPDLLILSGVPSPSGEAGYWPVDVKHHKTMTQASGLDVRRSALADPRLESAVDDPQRRARYREDDLIQLAHYWRMLEACGQAPDGQPTGGIIGSDPIDGNTVIVWHDLAEPVFKTFSRSAEEGWTWRSALQRHDHEHGFRLAVAAVARQRRGEPDDPVPLVEPVYVDECGECPWFDYCETQFGDGDASAALGRLDAREWLTLRSLGIRTVTDLAALEVDQICREPSDPDSTTAAIVRCYLPEVTHQSTAHRRLASVVVRAQMSLAGQDFRQTTTGALVIPRADIEIDLDIENDPEGRVYLWGMLLTERATGSSNYVHVSDFTPTTEISEADLAASFWQQLSSAIGEADGAGRTCLVFHYAHPEPSSLRRISAAGSVPMLPDPETVERLIDERFVDLYAIMRTNFVGFDGLGLKGVAMLGAGFAWRDEDPGGLQSQAWLVESQAADDPDIRAAAISRVLTYNEDDVRATLAVREWLAGGSL